MNYSGKKSLAYIVYVFSMFIKQSAVNYEQKEHPGVSIKIKATYLVPPVTVSLVFKLRLLQCMCKQCVNYKMHIHTSMCSMSMCVGS